MHTVTLHVYDLSQGMARQFSPALLGRQINGIWHTGIVVYGKEYYYGGGILNDVPLRTPYGNPVETHNLGTTEITQEMFEDFLNGLRSKYSMEKYHLLENNCNHFTNECSQFLLGKDIPVHISGLPADVMNTPFGMMLKPMIDQFFSAQGWGAAMGPVSAQNPAAQENPLLGFGQNLFAGLGQNPSLFGQNPSPFGQAPFGQSPFGQAPFGNQNPLSMQSPSSFRPAGDKLHPRHTTGHKHVKLNLPNVVHPSPVLFNQADNIPTIYQRLFQNIGEEKEKCGLTQEEETNLKLSQNALGPTQNINPSVIKTLEKLIQRLSPEKVFPAFDILRIILLQSAANAHFANVQNPFIVELIKKYTKDSPRPAHLLAYRVAANMFSTLAGVNYLLHTPEHLAVIVDSVVSGLHVNDKIMRKTVATLCYDTCLFLDRRHSEEVLQILSALAHLLSTTSPSDDPETDARQLLALGTLLYCNDSAIETAQLLEVGSSLSAWANSPNQKVKDVVKEITLLLQ
eukprot:Phypoly_transcript_06539.p1 GENE.Phypoly_transcript_06539~~Phypoly_transcript_06539.p1  ORF type:complete len:512 (+),score=69.70 Phypoly_transcript_06539:146-1681(+)